MNMKEALLVVGMVSLYAFLNYTYGSDYENVFKLIGNVAVGWMICDIVTTKPKK